MNPQQDTLELPGMDEALFHQDKWDAQAIGLTPNPSHSSYGLNFSRFHQGWLKHAVKRFIRLQANTKSYSTCSSYLTGLAHFSEFLSSCADTTNPNGVNRRLIVTFIHYLATKKLGVVSRRMALIHLRTFHDICRQENWLPWPDAPLVLSSDLPQEISAVPQYIPDTVMTQLKAHLHHLPAYQQRLIILLIETGRRISEICSLPYDCLAQDNAGDWYLNVHERKLKRTRLLPISSDCYHAVKEQQLALAALNTENQYLFPVQYPGVARTPHVGDYGVNRSLKRLAQQYNIVDDKRHSMEFSLSPIPAYSGHPHDQ